jgi:hypothetical protein
MEIASRHPRNESGPPADAGTKEQIHYMHSKLQAFIPFGEGVPEEGCCLVCWKAKLLRFKIL